MYNTFHSILIFGLQASFLVLAVIILRLILRKAPKYIICALWVLVAVRLLFPFEIQSVFSLIPHTETIVHIPGDSEVRTITQALPAIDVPRPRASESAANDLPITAGEVLGADVFTALLVIWIAALVLMLLYALFSYIKLYRLTRESIKCDDCFLCDKIQSPFILGVIRPKIILPFDLDEADKPYILAHEKAHIKRRDHWWKPLGFLLLSVYWFNPLLWVAYILLCRDIELACDEKVIKELGFEVKKPYANALINTAAPKRTITACPLAFGETGVKSRIKNVLNYKKPAFWIIIVAVVLSIVVAVCFLTNPVKESVPDYFVSSDGQIEAEYAYSDIDNDGKEEMVVLSPGPTSGISSYTIGAYDKVTHKTKYIESTLYNWGFAEFVKDDKKLYITGKNFTEDTDGSDEKCVVSVKGGTVQLIKAESAESRKAELQKLEPIEAADKFFQVNFKLFPEPGEQSGNTGWSWSAAKTNYYGGTYLDGAEQVILLTDLSGIDSYEPVGKDIRYEKCEHSLSELESEINSINLKLTGMRGSDKGYSDSVVQISLLDSQNKVEVCIFDMTDEKKNWFKETFGDFDYLIFRNVTEKPNTDDDITETKLNRVPGMVYVNDHIAYICGDCGIIFYDIENGEIKGMISQSYLQNLGYRNLYADASPDGDKIYLYDLTEKNKYGIFDVTSGNITTYDHETIQEPEFFGYDSVYTAKADALIYQKDGTEYELSVQGLKLGNMELTVENSKTNDKKTYRIFE